MHYKSFFLTICYTTQGTIRINYSYEIQGRISDIIVELSQWRDYGENNTYNNDYKILFSLLMGFPSIVLDKISKIRGLLWRARHLLKSS